MFLERRGQGPLAPGRVRAKRRTAGSRVGVAAPAALWLQSAQHEVTEPGATKAKEDVVSVLSAEGVMVVAVQDLSAPRQRLHTWAGLLWVSMVRACARGPPAICSLCCRLVSDALWGKS